MRFYFFITIQLFNFEMIILARTSSILQSDSICMKRIHYIDHWYWKNDDKGCNDDRNYVVGKQYLILMGGGGKTNGEHEKNSGSSRIELGYIYIYKLVLRQR